MSRGWKVLIVPQSKWLSFCGDAAQQEAYLRQLLSGLVEFTSCSRQDELKAAGKSVDNSNASTDDEEAFEAINNYAAT